MKFCILLSAAVLFATQVLADDDEGGMKKDRVGPDKAVLDASETEGLRIAPETLKLFDVRMSPIDGREKVAVPATSLVHFQDFSAVYRVRDGWFRMVEIEPEIKNDTALFSSKEFRKGDQIVVQNAALLRVVELDIFGPEADACAD